MAQIACESKLRSVVGHTCIHAKEKCVAIGRAVVYSARVARIFSAGIKYRHCTIVLHKGYGTKLPLCADVPLGNHSLIHSVMRNK